VRLYRQVRRSALDLVAIDPSLGKDGHRPTPGENRERRLEAADVGLILFYRECAHSAQVAPYNGPLEQMSGREERKTPAVKTEISTKPSRLLSWLATTTSGPTAGMRSAATTLSRKALRKTGLTVSAVAL